MTDWARSVEASRERLLEEFHHNPRFEIESSDTIHGDIDVDERLVPVDITIPSGFPYSPPSVRPIDGTGGLSWHANLDGTLCLWASEQSGDLPWLHVEQIVAHAQMWFRNEAAGWNNDSPDLDLERYWPNTTGLVAYPDLDNLVGHLVRAERRSHVWLVKPGPAPEGGRQRAAFVVDVGELDRPVHDYDEICKLLDDDVTRRLTRQVTPGRSLCCSSGTGERRGRLSSPSAWSAARQSSSAPCPQRTMVSRRCSFAQVTIESR